MVVDVLHRTFYNSYLYNFLIIFFFCQLHVLPAQVILQFLHTCGKGLCIFSFNIFLANEWKINKYVFTHFDFIFVFLIANKPKYQYQFVTDSDLVNTIVVKVHFLQCKKLSFNIQALFKLKDFDQKLLRPSLGVVMCHTQGC